MSEHILHQRCVLDTFLLHCCKVFLSKHLHVVGTPALKDFHVNFTSRTNFLLHRVTNIRVLQESKEDYQQE